MLHHGSVAQLVEHYLDMVVVVGSSPIGATTAKFNSAILLIWLIKNLVFQIFYKSFKDKITNILFKKDLSARIYHRKSHPKRFR